MTDDVNNPYLYALNADPGKPMREAQAQIARLTAERDEARRELCRIESSASGDPNMTSRAVAADCGWDCFKEDGK